MSEAAPADLLPSPCVGTCTLDDGTGWCLGCGRSGDEIAAWRDLNTDARRTVWDDLPSRLARLGLALRLWPWAGTALFERLAKLSADRDTVWTLGVYGAVGEFWCVGDEPVSRTAQDGTLVLTTARGGLRLRVPRATRLFERIDGQGRVTRLVLALHRAHLKESPAAAVTELGTDTDALAPEHRSDHLFDLGLARYGLRFCIRTGRAELLAALRAQAGQPVAAALPALIGPLLAHNPHRVLLGPAGRMEIRLPIGGSDASPRTPDGPHTHLLPELLATGRDLEPGLDLPGDYLSCLSVYPGQASRISPHG